MAKIILVTGGARSGKSSFAQEMAEKILGEKIYLATCPADQGEDAEMQRRIDGHIKARKNRGWQTIEEPIYIVDKINSKITAGVILIDCLTLWISNLMYEFSSKLTEEELAKYCQDFLAAAKICEGTIILVSNEVGSGIVPENDLARRYRDLVGRCNQLMAAGSDEVFLVSCGLPLKLKG